MENIILINNQENIVKFIVDQNKKLNKDKAYREKTYEKYLPKKKYSTNQNYKVIAEILEKEIKVKGYGKVTVWRVLKIYETDKEAYKRIKNGESIKKVYNQVFGESEKEVKPEPAPEPVIEQPKIEVKGDITFQSAVDVLLQIKDFIDNLEPDEALENDIEKVRQQLFWCSKAIQKKNSEIARNRKWDPEEY